MNIYDYLKIHSKNLTTYNIHDQNMEDYQSFKTFIDEHYNLKHIQKNNYIKYVKVTRQKIVFINYDKYHFYINQINQIIELMSTYHIFYKINFNKYLFNIDKLKQLLHRKEKNLKDTICSFQDLYSQFEMNNKIQFQILHTINNYRYKYHIFKKLKREVLNYINEFIKFEESYGIDQKLIQIVNMERTLIGKKSEYNVSRLIQGFIQLKNQESNTKKYYYKENIDIFKLLQLKSNDKNYKGEVDGLILIEENGQVSIDTLIEVKSSIKATFEDVYKIVGLQKIIRAHHFKTDIYIDDLVLTHNSFNKILNNPMHIWNVYMCIDQSNKIDKSHLYFAYVLKIIDHEFIKDYYINNKDNILQKKHQLILKKEKYIQQLFNLWVGHVKLNETSSCVFLYE